MVIGGPFPTTLHQFKSENCALNTLVVVVRFLGQTGHSENSPNRAVVSPYSLIKLKLESICKILVKKSWTSMNCPFYKIFQRPFHSNIKFRKKVKKNNNNTSSATFLMDCVPSGSILDPFWSIWIHLDLFWIHLKLSDILIWIEEVLIVFPTGLFLRLWRVRVRDGRDERDLQDGVQDPFGSILDPFGSIWIRFGSIWNYRTF